LDWTKAVLIGVALLVALVATSRNLASVWTIIYKLMVGAIFGGICLFAMQKVDTTDDVKLVTSFVVGILVSFAASAIPWR
jgi:hypothetical protein